MLAHKSVSVFGAELLDEALLVGGEAELQQALLKALLDWVMGRQLLS